MGTITSANAVLTLAIAGLYPVPQQLQGFAAEDIFGIDDVETGETSMGVDGILSAGFVFVPTNQNIFLQADSVSNLIFENWDQAEQVARDKYFANGTVVLPSVNTKYAMTNGVLVSLPRIPSAKKTLQPRKYVIRWESVSPAPF